VSEPVIDYIRFEHAITATVNIAAGEQVRWLPQRQCSDLCLPVNDFWVLDDKLKGRVPSILTLAQEHGVSHKTTARALTTLRDEGLIVSASGKGYYVAAQ
jgi:biotin operon repressor